MNPDSVKSINIFWTLIVELFPKLRFLLRSL